MNMSENKIINLNDLSKSYAVPEEGETFGKEQSLGLVLTPVHIADLMSKMAGTNKDTIIYDPCSGTGTFLTSTLEEIRKFTTAKVDTHLVGSEIREDIYNVALNNLISHGVSKPHLYNGDCFKLEETVKLHHPTVVLLNPPYEKQKRNQLNFIKHALDVVEPKGIVGAIVQMSTMIDSRFSEMRQSFLNTNKLFAVCSLPPLLFHPEAAVITSLVIFEKGTPNKGNKTWFANFKDDGFIKSKNKGMIDSGKWEEIEKEWLDSYKHRKVLMEFSALKEGKGEDEWCVEAYFETDYSKITKEMFIKRIKEYEAYKFLNDI